MPTIVNVLRDRAQLRPTDRAYLFMDEEETWVSYADMDRAARRVMCALLAAGAAGKPVLLLYPPGRAYVEGFLGCLYAGAIAVPAYPPDPLRLERTLPRLRALLTDCGARVALSTSAVASAALDLASDAPELAALDWLGTDELPSDLLPEPPVADGDQVALVQYTSGSTGTPRGVVLTHANLAHNLELIRTGFAATAQDVGVSWLPPYHDMGLIGGILQPLYAGLPMALMSPLTFLHRPMIWLETISQLGATISGGPNFAFDLCVRKSTSDEREQLDLSRWAVAFSGAEPVRADTLDRFAAAFAPAGFRPTAFYPCYGLAEATLIVTGGGRADPPRQVTIERATDQVTADQAISCGGVLGDQRLTIVDPVTTRQCPAGTVGEIWLSGPSVARGYWNRPQETVATFHAHRADDPGRRYLRTGDLGLVDASGELVVTGRAKDLIIVRGRNIYPHDIELAAERDVAGLRPGCSAAFPVGGEEERVGFAGEIQPNQEPAAVISAIRQVLAEVCDVSVAEVVLVRAGHIPKTSSGKIQRHACRRLTTGIVARWDESTADEPAASSDVDRATTTDSLTALIAETLGVSAARVSEQEPLTRLGLDSLRAMELRQALLSHAGKDVSLSELLAGASVATLRAMSTTANLSSPAAQTTVDAADLTAAPALDGDYPATDGQRALWFVQRWAPRTTAYQVSRAARITAMLDIDALDRALRALVTRHPALRTCLPAHNGEPVQRVFRWDGPVLTRHDASGLDESAMRQRVQAEADRVFDLERGPLMRAALYSRSDRDHVLVLSLHHTITDFWSLSVMIDELLALYAGQRLPFLAQQPLRSGAVTDHRLAYWRSTLHGAPPALELPTTSPRPSLQSFDGAQHRFRLDAATVRRLDSFTRENGVTRFVTLLAAFMTVLARHTDEDVVVGTPTTGRDGPDSRFRLGYFVTPVPLRVRVRPELTFRALVADVRAAVLGALEHAVPFPQLVRTLRPVRDPGRPVLIQTMMVLHQAPPGRSDLAPFAVADEDAQVNVGGLDLRPLRLIESSSAFDLSLIFAEVAGALTGVAEYRTDLFDQPAIERFTGQFSLVLAQATAAPDQPVGALELLADEERARILSFGTPPAVPFPDQNTLPALFSHQAGRRPRATAVEFENRSLTYAELDAQTDRLAQLLRARFGIRRGAIVGVFLERGLDPIVAFWATLKAGAVYLPLDPDLPQARLEWMLADAAPAVVVTQRTLADRLSGRQLLIDDERWVNSDTIVDSVANDTTDAAPDDTLPTATGPDDLAYLIYTSGSTGRPKGVLVPHRGARNVGESLGAALGVTEADRVLQYASCAFDASIAEILIAHLRGAALHMTPRRAVVPGPELLRLLSAARITAAILTPSTLSALPDGELPDLVRLLSAGEACSAGVVARWGSGRRFINAYGPTETSICASWAVCAPDHCRPTIGGPMANVHTYVVDSRLRPVPIGMPGELCIGGVGVADGYLNRPDLTAERFVPDPFSPIPGARMYRSGDRVRWLPNATLDFLGRLDDQVKVHGIRIEPGEIAARLGELLGIREVAVVARSRASEVELVAYLVSTTRRPVAELRDLLRAELPGPWVPAAFVYLDALPHNVSGKLDRSALPPPRAADRGLASQVAARTPMEAIITEVWMRVLGHDAIGVNDHFFEELGGSSLLVAKVTSELSQRLDREVPVTHLFEHPTIEALARRLQPETTTATTGTEVSTVETSPTEVAQARRRALAARAQRERSRNRDPHRQ